MKLGIYESSPDYFWYLSKDMNKSKLYYITDLRSKRTWVYDWTQKRLNHWLTKIWKWKYSGKYIMEIK